MKEQREKGALKKKEKKRILCKKRATCRIDTWWQKSWWVRIDNGPHLRTARGRRQAWRAATRAAREMRDREENQCESGEKERREWKKGETERRESNTLHIVLHLQSTAAAAASLHEVPSHDLLPQPFIARDRFVAAMRPPMTATCPT